MTDNTAQLCTKKVSRPPMTGAGSGGQAARRVPAACVNVRESPGLLVVRLGLPLVTQSDDP
jgi:hypothetical protein